MTTQTTLATYQREVEKLYALSRARRTPTDQLARNWVEERLTREDITFGYGGWAPALSGPGLGVTVDAAAVERLAVEKRVFKLI